MMETELKIPLALLLYLIEWHLLCIAGAGKGSILIVGQGNVPQSSIWHIFHQEPLYWARTGAKMWQEGKCMRRRSEVTQNHDLYCMKAYGTVLSETLP